MNDAHAAMPLLVLVLAICWTQGSSKCVPTPTSIDIRDALVSQFKKKVLRRLGYSVKPNVTGISIDQLRKDMLHKFTREHGLTLENNIPPSSVHVYRETTPDPQHFSFLPSDLRPLHTASFRLHNTSLTDKKVQRAWLKFCNKNIATNKVKAKWNKKGRMQVYQIDSNADTSGSRRHLVFSRPIKSLTSVCSYLDITEAFKQNFAENVTFAVVILSEGKSPTLEGTSRSSLMTRIRSTLLLNVAERSQSVPREKRETGKSVCTSGDGETRCCRYHTYISFKEIGWDDWVVAPEGYDAYYCAGECPRRFKMANTFSGIKSLLNLIDPSRIPPPTCTATQLRPLTLLHLDDTGKMTYTDHPDMIVDGCQCS